jgi:hypothetical protein
MVQANAADSEYRCNGHGGRSILWIGKLNVLACWLN